MTRIAESRKKQVCLSVFLPVCPSGCLFLAASLCVCLPACLSVSLSCLSVCLSVCLSACLLVRLPVWYVCLSVFQLLPLFSYLLVLFFFSLIVSFVIQGGRPVMDSSG